MMQGKTHIQFVHDYEPAHQFTNIGRNDFL